VVAAALRVVLVTGGAEADDVMGRAAGDVVGRAAGDVVGRAAAWAPLVVLLPRASAIWEDEDAPSSDDGAPPQALRAIAPASAMATREGIRIYRMLRENCDHSVAFRNHTRLTKCGPSRR
jgi:hypothetical protein